MGKTVKCGDIFNDARGKAKLKINYFSPYCHFSKFQIYKSKSCKYKLPIQESFLITSVTQRNIGIENEWVQLGVYINGIVNYISSAYPITPHSEKKFSQRETVLNWKFSCDSWIFSLFLWISYLFVTLSVNSSKILKDCRRFAPSAIFWSNFV